MGLGRQVRFKIENPERLAEEVQYLIDGHGGNQYQAAKQTGIPQPRLSRLLNKAETEIGVNYFMRLHAFIAPERMKYFLGAFFTKDWKAAYESYLRWIEITTQSLTDGPGEYWLGELDGVAPADDFGSLPHVLHAQELNVLQDYWERECYTSHNRFNNEMKRLKVTPERRELARLRILAPLLDYRASAFVERGWDELDKQEFEAFVESGVTRETILLRRSNLLQRLQQVL